jgi:RecJ-like exonuclease
MKKHVHVPGEKNECSKCGRIVFKDCATCESTGSIESDPEERIYVEIQMGESVETRKYETHPVRCPSCNGTGKVNI